MSAVDNRRFTKWDLGVLLGAFALSLLHAAYFDHVCDDAYISFRYADNLARGDGMVFNPGEFVMGYSNLLWVLLLGAFELMGIAAPTGAKVLGTTCAWITLARVHFHLRAEYRGMLPALAASSLLVLNGTFAVWMFGGLEGHLFACLLTCGVVEAMRIRSGSSVRCYIGSGVLLGLAALTRPEGVFYAVPIGVWLYLREPGRKRAVGVAAFTATVILFYLAMSAWAFYYYGDPLPNSYYAKMHPLSLKLLDRGWDLTRGFLDGYLGVHVLIGLLWAGTMRLSRSSAGWLPVGVIAAFVVFFLRIGGDALVYHRMWLWVLPMFSLLAAEALARIVAVRWSWRLPLAAGLVILMAGLSVQHSFLGREVGRLRRDEVFVQGAATLGELLRSLPPNTLVAANNVGALAYASRLRFVDMLGLNDRHIARAPGKRVGIPAHESHDGAYVLDRGPDLIFYGMPRLYPAPIPLSQAVGRGYSSDLDLVRDRRFRQRYELTHLRVQDGRYAPVFKRR